MIPNMATIVFHDEIEAGEKAEKKRTQEKKLANYFGCEKSETQDDADEIVVVENVDEL